MGVSVARLDRGILITPDTPVGTMLRVMVPTLGDQCTLCPGQSLVGGVMWWESVGQCGGNCRVGEKGCK